MLSNNRQKLEIDKESVIYVCNYENSYENDEELLTAFHVYGKFHTHIRLSCIFR